MPSRKVWIAVTFLAVVILASLLRIVPTLELVKAGVLRQHLVAAFLALAILVGWFLLGFYFWDLDTPNGSLESCLYPRLVGGIFVLGAVQGIFLLLVALGFVSWPIIALNIAWYFIWLVAMVLGGYESFLAWRTARSHEGL